MKKLLISSLAIATAFSAVASAPKPNVLGLSPNAASRMMSYLDRASARFDSLSDEELSRELSYTDAKGNVTSIVAPANAPDIWAHKDSAADKIEGTSTEKAYRDLKLTAPAKPVIVAVVDSGVDVNHEDLKGRIVINESELNGLPGIDDDGDGFVDNIYGWNFLGGKNGENVDSTTLEVTREYARLSRKAASREGLTAEERTYFDKVTSRYDNDLGEARDGLATYNNYLSELTTALGVLKAAGLKEETVLAAQAVTSADPIVISAKKVAVKYLSKNITTDRLGKLIKQSKAGIDFYYNTAFDSSVVVGDDPAKLDEVGYGNNDVKTEGAFHGTHCSGIIGATRNNGIGIDGQAEWVKILPVRAVPDGDERDKDVANAVRYAVDHGAQIISMSFGKPFSPQKSYVDAAFKYAEEKGVLVVHAAGNESEDNDVMKSHFPNRDALDGAHYGNWLEVGASAKLKGAKLPASFTSYGKTATDLFAPGVNIYSTTPDNMYQMASGTSMATPEVAGIAALVLSQYPQLTAVELKALLQDTVTKYEGLQVLRPGTQDLMSFADMSVTGGIVNSYNALKAAAAKFVRVDPLP